MLELPNVGYKTDAHMGLKDLKSQSDEIIHDVENYGKKSGSSSNYPKTREKIPRLAIYEKDGQLTHGIDAQDDIVIVMEKRTEHSGWKKKYESENLVRYWMSDSDVRYVKHLVQKELNLDFFELLHEDEEKALRAVDQAAKANGRSKKPSMYRDCPVCGDPLHIVAGDWVKIKHRRVCDDHTTKELIDSGLM